ncbi:MAG: 50S ribosomal protein L22 [Candidatus Bipolaricaulia bacterium]
MEAKAVVKMVRISPYKARLVIDQIRDKDVDEALNIARFSKKKAARFILKALESAIANAENNHDMDADELWVKEAYVDEGPSLKRVKPRARGSADLIRHRTSHITVVLSDEWEEEEGEEE